MIAQLVKCPDFSGTRRLITVFITARHWTPSYPEPVESSSHPHTLLNINFNIILPYMLGLQTSVVPSGSATKTLCKFILLMRLSSVLLHLTTVTILKNEYTL